MSDKFIVGCLIYRKPKTSDFHIYYYESMKELWFNRYHDEISIYIVSLHYLDARDGLSALVKFCREYNRKLYLDTHACSDVDCSHNTKLLIIVDHENLSKEIKNIIPEFTTSEIIITQEQYNDMINNIKNKHQPTYENMDIVWSNQNKRLENIYGNCYLTIAKKSCIIM